MLRRLASPSTLPTRLLSRHAYSRLTPPLTLPRFTSTLPPTIRQLLSAVEAETREGTGASAGEGEGIGEREGALGGGEEGRCARARQGAGRRSRGSARQGARTGEGARILSGPVGGLCEGEVYVSCSYCCYHHPIKMAQPAAFTQCDTVETVIGHTP